MVANWNEAWLSSYILLTDILGHANCSKLSVDLWKCMAPQTMETCPGDKIRPKLVSGRVLNKIAEMTPMRRMGD